MTVDDVINLCKDVPEGAAWELETFGGLDFIRLVVTLGDSGNVPRCFCPNTWACYKQCGQFYEPHQYDVAADRMGLDLTAANLIASAADANFDSSEVCVVRNRLMKELKPRPQEVSDEG